MRALIQQLKFEVPAYRWWLGVKSLQSHDSRATFCGGSGSCWGLGPGFWQQFLFTVPFP